MHETGTGQQVAQLHERLMDDDDDDDLWHYNYDGTYSKLQCNKSHVEDNCLTC